MARDISTLNRRRFLATAAKTGAAARPGQEFIGDEEANRMRLRRFATRGGSEENDEGGNDPMDIICASICYRGFADDEVAATLERAPALGYRCMEIHGDAVWTPPAVKVFDLPGVQARLKASGMRCAGIYTPCWGGADEKEVDTRAEAIAACVRFRRGPGRRPRHFHRRVAPRRAGGARAGHRLRPPGVPADVRPEPRQAVPGAPLRQRAGAGRGFRAGPGGGRPIRGWACASTRGISTRPASIPSPSSAATPPASTRST